MVAGTSHIPAKVKALPFEGASLLWYWGCSVAVLNYVKLMYMLFFVLSVWMGLCIPTWHSNCTSNNCFVATVPASACCTMSKC